MSSSVVDRASRLILAILAALCAAVGALGLWSAPARAATPHEFVGSFGPNGPGLGPFAEPTGVAVEQSSGDVFVYEAGGGGRIYKFNEAGQPVKSFSSDTTNVIEGVGGGEEAVEESEIAVSSSGPDQGDIYLANDEKLEIYSSEGVEEEGTPTGKEPCGVAVSPSGAVYVAFRQEEVIKKYVPVKNPVTKKEYESSLSGVKKVCNIAADAAGDIYAAYAAYVVGSGLTREVKKYAASEFGTMGVTAFGAPFDSVGGSTVAVDPSSGGGVYVDEGSGIAEYSSSGTRVGTFGESGAGALRYSYGVAVSQSSGYVYGANHSGEEEEGEVNIYTGSSTAVLPVVSEVGVSGQRATSAVLDGTVNPEGTSVTECVFEYGSEAGVYTGSVPCSEESFSGDSPVAVSASVSGLLPDRAYYFRLLVTDSEHESNPITGSTGQFTTLPAGPGVGEESVAGVTSTAAELQAQIDPRGVDTTYYFQYGPTTSYGTSIPAPPGADIGAGEVAQSVVQQARGLTPGSTYHYRVLAVQGSGGGSEEVPGPDRTFTTQPPAGAFALPDGRAWELVSPPEKDGAGALPIGGIGGASEPVQAAADGGAIAYATDAPIEAQAQGNRSPEGTPVISRRTPGGWSSREIITPHEKGEGLAAGSIQDYLLFSSDLSLALLQPKPTTLEAFEHPPLSPEASEATVYLRENDASTCEIAQLGSCYTPLVTGEEGYANVPAGTKFGLEAHLAFRGAAPDLAHAVLYSEVALTPAPAPEGGLYEWSRDAPASKQLQLVSVLPGPGGKAAALAELGDLITGDQGQTLARNAISADGSRVFWTAEEEEEGQRVTHLYMRDTTTEKTIKIDAAQGVPGPNPEQAARFEKVDFQIASAEGSRVFFTDTYPLTPESTLEPSENGPADLYVCEVTEDECELKDLTANSEIDPDFESGQSAEVVGMLPGSSEDGSYVYFVANGLTAEAQAEGVQAGDCGLQAAATATCNLYVEHYSDEAKAWEAPRFIATLSGEDSPDWGETGVSLSELTARVSPSGRYLAFMSKQPLTGYDNVDQSPGADGARDEEVFLYDAVEGRLACASCNPTGERPRGVLDDTRSGGLLVDRPSVWAEAEGGAKPVDHWLAGSIPGWSELTAFLAPYQSRYLSDEGRLFFNSPDDLVPQATNGKEDVYEYEPPGVGGCETSSAAFSARSEGCVALISAGESEQESAFLDASESGDDVFFVTDQRLVGADHDESYDVYDAHVCGEASPCLSQQAPSSTSCEALQTCRGAGAPLSLLPGPSGSATFSGPGNPAAPGEPPSKASKPPTRAQRLAGALKECGKRDRGRAHRKKRLRCEARARKRYRPKRHGKAGKGAKRSKPHAHAKKGGGR